MTRSGRVFLRFIAALAPPRESHPAGEHRHGYPCAGFGDGSGGTREDRRVHLVFEGEAGDRRVGRGRCAVVDVDPTVLKVTASAIETQRGISIGPADPRSRAVFGQVIIGTIPRKSRTGVDCCAKGQLQDLAGGIEAPFDGSSAIAIVRIGTIGR